jgi:hypothetical protein
VTAPRLFLSYAHSDADKKFVSALYDRLSRDGIECFFDEVSLAPGANFVLKISEAIDECNYLVMVMSNAYFSAQFAPLEWTAVLSEPPERRRLLPLLLEQCEVPALVRPLSYIDVSSDEKLAKNYPRIWQYVGRLESHDIEQRSKEIDDLFEQHNVEQGMKRLLDFARDFAKQRKTVFRLTAIKWELERNNKESDPEARAMVRVDLLAEGLNLKDGIITSLSLEASS